MAKKVAYPFVPKSTASLRPGQFWQIPLSDGRFACGRVLQLPGPKIANSPGGLEDGEYLFAGSRTTFFAGLTSWCGDHLPTSEAIAGSSIVEQGCVHLRTIVGNRGQILGCRPLELDEIAPMPELSQNMPVEGTKLVQGLKVIRDATLQERQTLFCHEGWSPGYIVAMAERYFVKNDPPKRRLPWTEMQEFMQELN